MTPGLYEVLKVFIFFLKYLNFQKVRNQYIYLNVLIFLKVYFKTKLGIKILFTEFASSRECNELIIFNRI